MISAILTGYQHYAWAIQSRPSSLCRYERAVEQERKRVLLEQTENELPGIVLELIGEIVTEEKESIASQEIQIGMQYIKVGVHHTESTDCQCGCASKIEKTCRKS